MKFLSVVPAAMRKFLN